MGKLKTLIALLALVGQTADATNWEYHLGSSKEGTFQASEAKHGVSLSGSFRRQDNGFIRQQINTCSDPSSGALCPPLGTTKFSLEAPEVAFFALPTLSTESQLISTVISGACPTSRWDGIWTPSLWSPEGIENVRSAGQAAFGTFSWEPSTNVLTITSMYNLEQGTLIAANFPLPGGACSNGQITLTGTGDRGGTMYISADQGGIYRTLANHAFFIEPQVRIPSQAALAGEYSAFNYDSASTQTILSLKVVIAGSTASASTLTDVVNDTTDPGDTWTISEITLNSPLNGLFRGKLSRQGSSPSAVTCIAYFSTKTVLFCTAQSPSDPTRPMNFAVVSDSQAFASGSLDTYYFGSPSAVEGENTTGLTSVEIGSTSRLHKVTIAPDGKIVAVGAGRPASTDFAVVRFHRNGSVDTSFGGGSGYVTTMFDWADGAKDVLVQPDGKILVAGIGRISGQGDNFALIRYDSAGALDTTFGAGAGYVTTDFGSSAHDRAYAMAVQSDGKIVVAGETRRTDGASDMALARYNADGSLDTGFGTSGKATLAFAQTSTIYDVALQSDGKIVVAGYVRVLESDGIYRSHFALARFLSGGTLDTGFGSGNGWVISGLGGLFESRAHALAIQPGDGRIVAGGYANRGSNQDDFALARFEPNGSPDTSFGGVGYVFTDIYGRGNQIQDIALTVDGIVAVGQGVSALGGQHFDMAVARYDLNGALVTSFGSGSGFVVPVTGTYNGEATGAALQRDGKIVVVGYRRLGPNASDPSQMAIARFWP
jgi:uncharacterized delta-60 repeat protein